MSSRATARESPALAAEPQHSPRQLTEQTECENSKASLRRHAKRWVHICLQSVRRQDADRNARVGGGLKPVAR